MLILVPASLGKTSPEDGDPVELDSLSFPELTTAREAVLESVGQPELRLAPAVPAREVYAGVTYDALELTALDDASSARADRSLVIISGLWGAIRPSDRIPAYRVPMWAKPGAVGYLPKHWRAPLAEVLPAEAGDGLILDCRSAEYFGVWKPLGDLAERTILVRPARDRTFEQPAHSYGSKRLRGLVAREALIGDWQPATVEELADAIAGLWPAQLRPPEKAGAHWELRVAGP